MTTNRTADDAFKLIMHSVEDFRSHHDPDDLFMALQNEIPEAKQQLLADILSLPCLQDEEESIYHPDAGDLLSSDAIVRNDLRVELVKAMTIYFMGGDVGVDVGASEEPTSQEQVGGKQADNPSAEAIRQGLDNLKNADAIIRKQVEEGF